MKQKLLYKYLIIIICACVWSGQAWGWGETPSYVLNSPDSHNFSYYTNKNGIEYTLSATGKKLTFRLSKQSWATTQNVFLYGYDSSGKEVLKKEYSIGDISTGGDDYTVDNLSSSIVKLKFQAIGTQYKTVSNVKVTRANSTFTTSTTSLVFDKIKKGESKSLNASISYINATYDQQVTGVCKDASGNTLNDFVVTAVTLSETGTTNVQVTFTPSKVGTQSGTCTLTNTNGKTVSFPVSGTGTQTYTFAANAIPNNSSYGSAGYELSQTSVPNSSNTSETATATFTATANPGYEFVCWGSSANATSDNTANPYSVTLTATETTPSQSKTLYAIFKPVFNFTATAVSSNTELGTATASFGDEAAQTASKKVLGDVGTNSLVQMATFTATPADADCVFLGWFDSNTYSGTPVSTDLTYSNVPLTSGINTTGTKTLYALFKKTHNLHWVDDDMDLNLVLGTTGLSSAASVTSGKTITYTCSNPLALTIDSNGDITTVGLGKSTVTASVEGDNIYIEQTLTRDFNVGEKKQAGFSPAWGDGRSTDIKVGSNTTIALTNIASDGTFSMVVTPTTGVISCSREGNTLTIHGDAAGTARLSLTQTGNTYLFGKTAEYDITVSKYATSIALVQDTPTSTTVGGTIDANVFAFSGTSALVPSADSDDDFYYTISHTLDDEAHNGTNVISYDPAANTITGLEAGTAMLTICQKETDLYYGTSRSFEFTVSRLTNDVVIAISSTTLDVDGTATVSLTDNVSNGAISASWTTPQYTNSSLNREGGLLSFDGTTLTGINAGTATVTITQAATPLYESKSVSFNVIVNKISNAIMVTLNGVQKNTMNIGRNDNETVTLGYTSSSNSNGTFHISLTSGSNAIATLSGNTISPGTADGVNIWTISQDETYMYEAATTTVRIKVNSIAEDPGYVYKHDAEISWDTYGGTGALELDGPGEFFTFEAKRTRILGVSTNYGYKAQYSTDDGSNWTSFDLELESRDTWYPLTFPSTDEPLPENTTHVQILSEAPAGGAHQVQKIIVTRKTFIRVNDYQGTDLGETYVDATPYLTKKFRVSYSTTNGGDIEIISNNPRFEVSPSKIEVAYNSDNVGEGDTPVEITVTYKPNKVGYEYAGAENATITVSDLFHSAELTFTATSIKRDVTIVRSCTETTTTVDGEIENVLAISGTFATLSDNSDDDFYYVISHSPSAINNGAGVISYNPVTNKITGLNGGTATLTVYQKNTSVYNATTSQSFTFTVNKLLNNTNIALSTLTFDVDGTSMVELTNNDSKGSLSASYSNNIYTNLSQNRGGELLSFNSSTNTLTGWNAGTGTVTITQAETYKYLSKSSTFNVTVNKVAQTLKWENPYLETTMQINTTLTGNAATSDADPSTFEGGVIEITYSSDNADAITVDVNTGDLTAVDEGSNISITATQAGNYKYLPATLTRLFSVFNKQTPAFIADAHFTGASSRVEYTCTATIRVTGVGADSEEGFTITNGDNSIIGIVRDGETITITGLAIGSTTLTLAQAGNEDYIAKSQTYNIEVYMPDDFLTLAPATTPSHNEGQYRKVFLNRTLKEGLSTIALPFNTTVEALTGRSETNDWVAQLETVTHTQADAGTKDEYTLYFKKVEGGVITANQPYVLHLGSEVVSPTWTDMADGISVSAASATEQSATKGYTGYGGWAMSANYEAGMNMEGKYGVVNGVGLQKGGVGSTLNAYAAYITAPSDNNAPLLRMACVDEDGTVTLIGNLSADADAQHISIYGPDGKRRSRLQPGVNIVRYKDGTVRKIQR